MFLTLKDFNAEFYLIESEKWAAVLGFSLISCAISFTKPCDSQAGVVSISPMPALHWESYAIFRGLFISASTMHILAEPLRASYTCHTFSARVPTGKTQCTLASRACFALGNFRRSLKSWPRIFVS
ncbi:hypothetical protein CEXT_606631 [Caerostris extrusa]|uniref:Uncharacterized protein n=1 Tax=Caerostris extrusa TaxID=172846 RepID=A0AAV4UZK3_CAEEX|nr:hypothetical protein CEXT_606631 [Caerostris extrusa]